MFLCSFALFGPPQAENFAIFRFLFTFLYVSGVISMVCERKIFQVLKNFTFFRIFQLGECKKFQKNIFKCKNHWNGMLTPGTISQCWDGCPGGDRFRRWPPIGNPKGAGGPFQLPWKTQCQAWSPGKSPSALSRLR